MSRQSEGYSDRITPLVPVFFTGAKFLAVILVLNLICGCRNLAVKGQPASNVYQPSRRAGASE